jgi:hypothetical protein
VTGLELKPEFVPHAGRAYAPGPGVFVDLEPWKAGAVVTGMVDVSLTLADGAFLQMRLAGPTP